ncbi:hypothetical protein, partial [Pantoea sp. alder70]|uniref:hypothetical protein n=1 Tax=Pantoea sp. alder70 TaxID=2913094 RepID=UPI001CD79D3A
MKKQVFFRLLIVESVQSRWNTLLCGVLKAEPVQSRWNTLLCGVSKAEPVQSGVNAGPLRKVAVSSLIARQTPSLACNALLRGPAFPPSFDYEQALRSWHSALCVCPEVKLLLLCGVSKAKPVQPGVNTGPLRKVAVSSLIARHTPSLACNALLRGPAFPPSSDSVRAFGSENSVLCVLQKENMMQ